MVGFCPAGCCAIARRHVAQGSTHKAKISETNVIGKGARPQGATHGGTSGGKVAPATEAAEASEEWIEIEDDEDEQIEVSKIPIAPSPKMPSAAEVEDHRINHFPYRCWCRECVMGRGLGEQRGRHEGRQHDIPRIGIDYWYITTGGLHRRDELPEFPENPEGDQALEQARKDKIMKCIILRCHESKALLAHAVPCKGADEDDYVVNIICNDVAWMGHTRLILKSDNEPALLNLIKRAMETIKVEIKEITTLTSETAPKYESQSNGGTECGIRHVRGLFRTIKLCTERRIGQVIPPTHPLAAWLVEHTAILINAMAVGSDGKTAWHRLRGRGFGQRLIGFGESVMFKQPKSGPGHDPEGNMGARLSPGTFLGYNKTSNTYRILAMDGNVIKARSILRRPFADRWRAEDLKGINVTPWSTRTIKEPTHVELGPEVEPHPQPEPEIAVNPRRLKITLKTLEQYGTTDGCQQCSHVRAFRETKPGLPHTERCRKRIIEAMQATDEGAIRVQRHEQRMMRHNEEVNQRLADHLEDADRALSGEGRDHHPHGALPGDVEATAGQASHADELPQVVQVPGTSARDTESAASAGAPPVSPERNGDEDMGVMTIGELKKKIDDRADRHSRSVDGEGEIAQIMIVLGTDPKSFKREKKQALRRLVSEVYSPPRVTEALRRLANNELAPGVALDLTTTDPDDGKPWDFDTAEKRLKARKLFAEQKPLFLIGSPCCTRWCTWQALNDTFKDPDVARRDQIRALVHLEFVASLYLDQVAGGRFFLHEHPDGATSWAEPCIESLLDLPGVERVRGDQCQYGQEVQFGNYKGQPIKKPTGFLSNAPRLLSRLGKRCEGRVGWECSRKQGGTHQLCSGRVAKEAARYSKELCQAIIKGMIDELRFRGMLRRGEVGLHAVTDDYEYELPPGCSGRYRDAISGQPLRDDLVAEARAKELRYFCEKGVWVKRPKHEARRVTGKNAISVRWVDVNKGDDMNPKYRSRLVARQMKAHDRSGDNFFAPTPPLEALRTVLSLAATTIGDWQPCYDPTSEKRTQIAMMDISRAYFNAKIGPGVHTYVQLPPEDGDAEDMVAKLLRHMYGTRAAADGWQEEYSTFLVETLKFSQGMSSPCIFRHPSKAIVISVHGDDFTAVGPKDSLDWYEARMKEHYELTAQPRLGPGPKDAKEAVVLNRIIRWGEGGIEYEADPRQAEKLVSECGLEGANTVATPGLRVAFAEVENDKPLPENLHSAFRGSAARANYLAVDRLDCQFAAKEVCRWMSRPTEASWAALKRLCRYLVGLPRMVLHFDFQTATCVDIYTDTDWAGCPRTRKSTSGGAVLFGGHAVKSWSSTQTSIALSSGEAEFNGVVRGAGVGLGYQSLLRDLGIEASVRIWTDSSAALGIASRQGLGKLRHIDTHTLWVQQAVRSRRIELRKVDGEVNPADLFTKHSLSRDRLGALVKLHRCEFRGGRAESAPAMRQTEGTKVTMAEINSIANPPVMPHLEHEPKELDEIYPAIEVPPEIDDEVPEDDAMFKHGMKVAEEIIDQSNAYVRRRVMQREMLFRDSNDPL